MKASMLIIHRDEAGAAQAVTGKVADLKKVAEELNVPVIEMTGDVSGKIGGKKPSNVDVIFVAGTPTGAQLTTACKELRACEYGVIIVQDALDLADGSVETALDELTDDKHLFQVTVAGAFKELVRSKHPFLYAYPKSDCTSTTVVRFKIGGKIKVLVIKRGSEPFKGKKAFAGGFLNPHLESLRRCAQRELQEEANIDLPEERFILIDCRSDPKRDPRGHIIDHGYLVLIEEHEQDAVLAQLKAGDDAEEYFLEEVATLLAEGMAFDHVDLLTACIARWEALGV